MNTKSFKSKEADPLHTYEIIDFDGVFRQEILFIKKEADPTTATGMKVVHQGTTNETVISVLIDRLQGLNELFPSQFNEDAIKHLHLALEALHARTKDREARGVEGTHQQ